MYSSALLEEVGVFQECKSTIKFKLTIYKSSRTCQNGLQEDLEASLLLVDIAGFWLPVSYAFRISSIV